MSQIKGKDTKPEIMIRKFLFSKGFRFRLYDIKLPGKPDLVLPKYKTVIFVNGCFWHGYDNCKNFIVPKTRSDVWMQKIEVLLPYFFEGLSKMNYSFIPLEKFGNSYGCTEI